MNQTQKGNQEERRNAIIQAAFTLFGQGGYTRATMKDIAAKAGVAQGLIGYHFGTKEALLVEVVREWMINRGMKAAFAQLEPHTSPAELLQQALLHVVQFRKENPEWFTLLISLWTESVNNEKLARELSDLYKEMKSGMIRILDRLELPLNAEEKETLASLVQAVFDGLTLQAPALLSAEPISHERLARGIGWILGGIRSEAEEKGGKTHE
ncbi:TetR/AcrR family transcriptional regulator [Saccharibacillus sp. CPCC 101409]|uniref:TetR/AcrR family transcriptional regulator n=1 Tax=Saccharibacillus sp. CPCC 101409 TaxID=3058041 RepID=UPI0026736B88|nr:TetR/AcrR family transcriptional regulator [Saccharibacillus sp. CPCC 101409]MDO3409760.1 TetR/AcrR family transcriptional regulator [Saccharibacillus sp. CPCC 101409]